MAGGLVYTVGRVIADLYAAEVSTPIEHAASFRKYVGGSSANTAVGLARLGRATGVVGRVGRDPMGVFIEETLQREGIDTTMLRFDPEYQTGLAFAALYPPNDSHVWFCGNPNANSRLAVEDLEFRSLAEARALVIAGTALAREPARSTVLALAHFATIVQVPVVLDVDWRPVFWEYPDQALAVYTKMLGLTQVVLANEPELAVVGGTPDMRQAAEHLLQLGVSEVVAKRGSQGAWSFAPHRDPVFAPAFSVPVLNTLGAGDAFAAGYVHALLSGWDVHERLTWANACGAIVVTRHSCSEAMPTAAEVKALWRGEWGRRVLMSERVRLTTAQALLRYLDAQYVTRDEKEQKFVAGVWGIFGHGNVLGLGEALESDESALPYLQGHSEQGMVHAAVAYAKQRRRLSIYACTTSIGPGATNLVTGAAGATINRLPVLLLPGDIFADRQPDPVLQQLEHPYDRTLSVNDALKPVSVFWDRIMRPEQLLAALPEAMATLVDPARTGAVTIALPQDVQAEAYDFPSAFFERRIWEVPRVPADPRELAAVVRALQQRKRPVIIAGGGVHYAEAEEALARLAEGLGIPVVETQGGKGTLTAGHPWNFGGVGVTGSRVGNELVRGADGILAVGTRLADFATASRSLWDPDQVLVVGLNVNRRDALKAGGMALVADAREGLTALHEALAGAGYQTAYNKEALKKRKQAWLDEVQQWYRPDETEPLRQTAVLGVLQEMVEPNAVIVGAAGSLPGDLHRLWQVKDRCTYHVEYGYSCMGYEIAGALGVKLAEPERPVYALVGDGSVLMLNAELVTMLQERQKVVIVVFDNRGYGSINSLQKAHGSRGFGTEFRERAEDTGQLTGPAMTLDFAKWGEAMGAKGFRATTVAEFREALQCAQEEVRASVVDVKVAMGSGTSDSGAWWRVDVAEVSRSVEVQRAREAWARHRCRGL